MDRMMKRTALTAEDFEAVELYMLCDGSTFEELDFGLNHKFGTLFGEKGRDAEIALLEEKLQFRFPASYIKAVVGLAGDTASSNFRSGWWRVVNDPDALILWSFTLSLSGEPSPKYPDENALLIAEKFEAAGLAGVPFGHGFRIDKINRVATDGWLYFNRNDGSLHFAEFDFTGTFLIAPDFETMMGQAVFVGYDA